MALFLLHVVFADVVRDYWQNAAPHFAHLDYDHLAKLTSAPQTNLSGEAALIQRWKSVWLNRWTSNHSLLGKCPRLTQCPALSTASALRLPRLTQCPHSPLRLTTWRDLYR